MKTTFLNDNNEGNMIERGLRHLESVAKDFRVFMNDTDGSEETGPLSEYGLSFDYVELGTWDDQDEDYYRYQFSWGGPSDELRIYEDGRIEYVFLDWFCGVGFDVSDEDWAQWIVEDLEDISLINWDRDRTASGYWEELAIREAAEDIEE